MGFASVLFRGYIGFTGIIRALKMLEINKTVVDLLFCFTIGILIVHASNSIQKYEESSNSLRIEGTKITTGSQK